MRQLLPLVVAALVALAATSAWLAFVWPRAAAQRTGAPVVHVLLVSWVRRSRLVAALQPHVNRLHRARAFPPGTRLLVADRLPEGLPWCVDGEHPPTVILAAHHGDRRAGPDELLAELALAAHPVAVRAVPGARRTECALTVMADDDGEAARAIARVPVVPPGAVRPAIEPGGGPPWSAPPAEIAARPGAPVTPPGALAGGAPGGPSRADAAAPHRGRGERPWQRRDGTGRSRGVPPAGATDLDDLLG